MMAPILEELEVDYAGVLDVEFIDVWQAENKEKAESYGIEEIPTQIFLDPDGKELWREAVLGAPGAPGPFAGEVAAGKLSFAGLNFEEKENEHFLSDFGGQVKIPVVAEVSGNKIIRHTVLDKAWFLFDDKDRYFDYIRNAVKAFIDNKEEAPEDDVAENCNYISARVAYERAKNEPGQFHIVDVRTPEEHVFVGHPEDART